MPTKFQEIEDELASVLKVLKSRSQKFDPERASIDNKDSKDSCSRQLTKYIRVVVQDGLVV